MRYPDAGLSRKFPGGIQSRIQLLAKWGHVGLCEFNFLVSLPPRYLHQLARWILFPVRLPYHSIYISPYGGPGGLKFFGQLQYWSSILAVGLTHVENKIIINFFYLPALPPWSKQCLRVTLIIAPDNIIPAMLVGHCNLPICRSETPASTFPASLDRPQRLQTVKPPSHRHSTLLLSLSGPYFPEIFRQFNTPKRWSLRLAILHNSKDC
jgi:hypothetical protein